MIGAARESREGSVSSWYSTTTWVVFTASGDLHEEQIAPYPPPGPHTEQRRRSIVKKHARVAQAGLSFLSRHSRPHGTICGGPALMW